jgi:Icc-related predicted phosphoesterase
VATYVVSDLHGATRELAGALGVGSTLVLLGDLINLLDYKTKTGILYEVFSVEDVEKVSTLRAGGRLEEARRVIGERAARKGPGLRSEIATKVRRQYAEVFASLVDPTYLILGNVDDPGVVERFAAEQPWVHLVDGRVVEIDGERFGFVGGALPTPFGAAGEVTDSDMAVSIDGLGQVDVLCSHIPPAVPELCFDTLAGRQERGSDPLLEYIRDIGPRVAYFGHVHQPLVSSMYVGRTLCVNVGYFRATKKPWIHARSHTSDGSMSD